MINRQLLHNIPRRITGSGNAIILPEQTADLAFIIERGTAKNTRTGKTFGPNTLLLPLELLRLRTIAATLSPQHLARLYAVRASLCKNTGSRRSADMAALAKSCR